MIKIVVADDHEIITEGICSLLEKESNIEIIGMAKNGVEVLKLLGEYEVDIAVLDIEMPEMNGVETTRRIAAEFPSTKAVILSMYKEKAYVKGVLDAGAKAYVIKEKSKATLVHAINTVFRGERYIPHEILDIYFSSSPKKEQSPLTRREKEILVQVAKGLTSKEIGAALQISPGTVDKHLANTREKLGLHRKLQLVKYVEENGLLDEE